MASKDADEVLFTECAEQGERIGKELMPALIQVELNGTVENLKLIDNNAGWLRKIFSKLLKVKSHECMPVEKVMIA